MAMISVTVPATPTGPEILAAAARAGAVGLGGDPEVTALAVRLAANDAVTRTIVNRGDAVVGLTIDVVGTELDVRVRDVGEPTGSPAATVLTMVDSGLVTGAESSVDSSGNVVVIRVPLPTHLRLFDDSGTVVMGDDAPRLDSPVRYRPLVADDALSLSRCIYRCYGWTYPGVEMYYPDRVAAAIGDGRRIGEVAVDTDGEVVAHWGAVQVAEGVVETGVTVTDPRYRKRGIAAELGERLLGRLVAGGVVGRMREPVMTHPATQRIALAEGATLVGFHFHAALPLQQVGITDGVLSERASVSVMYSALQPLAPATVWVPAVFEPFVSTILEGADWPRVLGGVQAGHDTAAASTVASSYDALNRTGVVTVDVVGADLVEAIDDVLGGLQRAGADMVMVRLPANQPALASLGAGLGSLSLAFASFLPGFGPMGDALVLQWLRDTDLDRASWVFANDDVADFAGSVAAQVVDAGGRATTLRRRDALRQQLFAALPGAEPQLGSADGHRRSGTGSEGAH